MINTSSGITQSWQGLYPLTSDTIQALFNSEIAGVGVDHFLAEADCSRLVQTLRSLGLKQYTYHFDQTEAPPAAHLFETHYLYENQTPQDYFPQAEQSFLLYKQLVDQSGVDPVHILMDTLQQVTGRSVEVAQQEGNRYFFAIARELNHSVLLHADYAPFIPRHWSISQVVAELAWNIYLTDPGEGGDCVVYDRFWQLEDDQHIIGSTYGYDPVVVSHCPSSQFKPKPGRLVLFNCRNFHAVEAASQPRVAIGGHIGLMPDGTLIFWS